MAESTDDAATEASESRDSLLVWSLATFHVTVLVVASVVSLHAVGALGDLLGGLGTAIGLGLFILLWGITWATNRRLLAECDLLAAMTAGRRTPDPEQDGTAPGWVILAGFKWGAVTGLVFYYGLLLLIVLPTLLSEVIAIAILLVAGTLVAPIVGGVVGGLLAIFDLGLLWIAGLVVPASSEASIRRD